MSKKYICVKGNFFQDMVDNWLLMIPSNKLSSDSKIVYMILKKIQCTDLSCNTDAHSWLKISGLSFERVKYCLGELAYFGLIELYFSTKNLKKFSTTFTCYLLHHHLMQDTYKIVDCPHDGDSFDNPILTDHILRNNAIASTIKEFKDSVQGLEHVDTNKSDGFLQENI